MRIFDFHFRVIALNGFVVEAIELVSSACVSGHGAQDIAIGILQSHRDTCHTCVVGHKNCSAYLAVRRAPALSRGSVDRCPAVAGIMRFDGIFVVGIGYGTAVEIVRLGGNDQSVSRCGRVLLFAQEYEIVVVIVVRFPAYEHSVLHLRSGVAL